MRLPQMSPRIMDLISLQSGGGLIRLNRKQSTRRPTLHALKVLSETMGKMPLKFYQEDESGGRVRAPTNDAADMLMHRPNPFMSPATFWSVLEANCEHYGNAYVWIQTTYVKKGGMAVILW